MKVLEAANQLQFLKHSGFNKASDDYIDRPHFQNSESSEIQCTKATQMGYFEAFMQINYHEN